MQNKSVGAEKKHPKSQPDVEAVSDRRDMLRHLIGGLVTVGATNLALVGCKSTEDNSSLPAACPATQPRCRILAVRAKTAGGDKSLWNTERVAPIPQGNWSAMTTVSPSILPSGFWVLSDLDEVTIPQGSAYGCEEAHLVLAVNARSIGTSFPDELLYKRQRANGTWNAFTTLSAGLGGTFSPGRPFRFSRVSATKVDVDLHVCAVTSAPTGVSLPPGKVFHAFRRHSSSADAAGDELGQWTGWSDVGALTGTDPGKIVDVACAGAVNPTTRSEELHLCVVTSDGRLLHSIRNAAAAWAPFGDAGQNAGHTGSFVRVACASHGGQLHVVAVTSAGRALYTIRTATAWRPFEDVQDAASAPLSSLDKVSDVAIGFYNEGLPNNQWQLNVVATTSAGLMYTVRSSQPFASPVVGPMRVWRPWSSLESETGYVDGGVFARACVGTRPRTL